MVFRINNEPEKKPKKRKPSPKTSAEEKGVKSAQDTFKKFLKKADK